MMQWLQIRFERLHGERRQGSPTKVLLAFFVVVVVTGALLLCLPLSSRDGRSCGILTALFTATSATCVTGLSLVDTYTQWSGLGQVVILVLIQIGGLGYMTFVSIFFFGLRRKIGLRERLVLQQSMALNEMDGIIRLVRRVLFGTLLAEGTGAVILSARFAVDFGLWRGIVMGVFHSISAFCNAGFDLMGYVTPGGSLSGYAADIVVNVTIMLLIVSGGLGFFVWNDLLIHRKWRKLSVHTKLVLLISGGLIFGGAALIFCFERTNPKTLGGLATWRQILASFFQSVTLRTAGFCTIDQGGLTEASKAVSILFMMIGGSSGSTAGGIKTVTMGLVLLEAFAVMRGRSRVKIFERMIPQDQIMSAMSLVALVTILNVVGAVALTADNGFPLLDSLFEVASAMGTVGLSAGVTARLNAFSQILIIIYMFFGRVGIMTISFALMRVRPVGKIAYPEARVLVG